MKSFHPIISSTVTLACSATSAQALLSKQPSGEFQLRLYNGGPNTVFVFFGTDAASAVATTSHMPVPAGAIEVITINNIPKTPVNYICGICASGQTATLYATVGAGI